MFETGRKVVLIGGWFAFAVPRGGGKTESCEAIVEWALFHNHKLFPILIGATADMAEDRLESLKKKWQFNNLLQQDFPEICFPISNLDESGRKVEGQLCDGERTSMVWSAKEIVLPTISHKEYDRWLLDSRFDLDTMPKPVSGSRVAVAGLTGSIRGLNKKSKKLKSLRPDLAVADDPQTRESAKSETQTNDRLKILKGDIDYLAGPDSTMALLMPCTVIEKGDLADRVLDRTKNPDFRGIRRKMLESMPDRKSPSMGKWDRYREIYVQCLLENDDNFDRATNYYSDHRDEMDQGFCVSWKDRHPGCLSAIQYAMNLYFKDRVAFFAEAQNDPMAEGDDVALVCSSDDIIKKQYHLERGQVPDYCTKTVSHVDVQHSMLFSTTVSSSLEFCAHTIDYGTFPEQNLTYFGLNDAITIDDEFGGRYGDRLEAQIFAALLTEFERLGSITYWREDGREMPIDLILVDVADGQLEETIRKAIRASQYSARIMACRGEGIKANSKPMSERAKKEKDIVGHHWFYSDEKDELDVDANYWKTQSHIFYGSTKMVEGVAVPSPGSLSLFSVPLDERHRMYADHMNAEYPAKVTIEKRSVYQWMPVVGSPRNEYLDNTYNCLAGLNKLGCAVPNVHDIVIPKKTRKRIRQKGRRARR